MIEKNTFFSAEKHSKRLDRAREYVEFLAETTRNNSDWLELLNLFEKGRLSLPQSLVLIHPLWYVDSNRRGPCPVRGPRSFDLIQTPAAYCQAHLYWGYECVDSCEEGLVRDHYFPYNLGGPTSSENMRWLCSTHNEMKGSDVHVLDLTQENFSWLERAILTVKDHI